MIKALFILTTLVFSATLYAEPYLAVKTGQKCASCHVSPTGGGLRNDFGQAYGRTLAQSASPTSNIDGKLSSNFQFGADYRGGLRLNDGDDQPAQSQFQTDRFSLYLVAQLLPQRLTLYLDQQFSPSSENRTGWVMWRFASQNHYLRAGKFFLPYGLRLEDDTAFVRQISGINFSSADNGIEFGIDQNDWSAQLALSNGTAGAAEIDNDKQFSARLAYIVSDWRIGGSINENNSEDSSRSMANIFAALNAWKAQWLFEFDRIKDDQPAGEVIQQIMFAELNKPLAAGHNLKLTHEWHDPNIDVDEDERVRNSIVWEYSPLQQMQIRSGVRISEGIPQQPLFNTQEVFGQLHVWF